MIECKIIEIEPEAQYGETVYTQTVVVKLNNGDELNVFDGTVPVLSSDQIGDQVQLKVVARANSISQSDQKPLVKGGSKSTQQYVGDIIEFIKQPSWSDLDDTIGICAKIPSGTIYVDMEKNTTKKLLITCLILGTQFV